MESKRNLCATEENEWDVFIAYYGNETTGTQRQAEILYDNLNGIMLKNRHKLKVYQHTRTNPNGPFGGTPEIARHSKIFLLLADKHIPVDSIGSLREKDASDFKKRLFDEVSAFSESPSYRKYYSESVCFVIACDDMTNEATTNLHSIFGGRKCIRLFDEINSNFQNIRSIISSFLIGDEFVPAMHTEQTTKALPERARISSTRGEIPIGRETLKRLERSVGKYILYEKLVRVTDIMQVDEEHLGLEIIPPVPQPFIPDADVFSDCEKILFSLKKSEVLTAEEEVFYRFIEDIKNGKKENKTVARVHKIAPILAYSHVQIQFQPIEYLWIMRMTLIDTPYNDGEKSTTLREKYALPMQEEKDFVPPARLSCHSGCGVFIITADGYLAYQNRFEKEYNRVSFFPGKKSYTVSGSYLMNGSTIPEFMNEKIENELGSLCHDLYFWELGYEYDYLHYQFSFFAFCDESKDEFVKYTHPTSSQAKKIEFFNLHDPINIANSLKIEEWESSAIAVLIQSLMSNKFNRLLQKKCGFSFDSKTFTKMIRSGI